MDTDYSEMDDDRLLHEFFTQIKDNLDIVNERFPEVGSLWESLATNNKFGYTKELLLIEKPGYGDVGLGGEQIYLSFDRKLNAPLISILLHTRCTHDRGGVSEVVYSYRKASNDFELILHESSYEGHEGLEDNGNWFFPSWFCQAYYIYPFRISLLGLQKHLNKVSDSFRVPSKEWERWEKLFKKNQGASIDQLIKHQLEM